MNLNKKEERKRNRLLKKWGYGVQQATADIEEDVAGAKSYHYEVHPTNIGDSIYLVYGKHRENITDYSCW